MAYDLDINKIILEIIKLRAHTILLQFPDGLKSQAVEVAKEVESQTKAKVIIWYGSCFGACDIPILPKKIEEQIDLFVQFGHNTEELKTGQGGLK
ncbi:MAG: hypothetical protein CVU81_03295 [Euryarchaeota archaeon HGW-Euryarchaeota-1]|nr:MAG: hypothetical protein CVU81_03295 [Euryarchaeota archaeon HGW-Euryarchaeota-1]